MTNFDVIVKLIGKVDPIGETREDERRFENLKEMCRVAELLIATISEVEKENRHSQEYSVKRASDYAKKFIETIKNDN